MKHVDVLIVGAGPAGIAAACGVGYSPPAKVTLLDDNPIPGGQIWRGGQSKSAGPQASTWFQKFDGSGAEILTGARVIGGDPQHRTLQIETAEDACEIEYDKLILATGARELFLPFPGWTLPNVMGVGGLQALVKNGLPVQGKRIVVAGSGPLLLAAADCLRQRGATVPLIAEQAHRNQLVRFGAALLRHPGKLRQSVSLCVSLGSTRYLHGAWIEAAEGVDQLASIRLRHGAQTQRVDCDYLAIAYGLHPNTELAQHLGCAIRNDAVSVDHFQQTSDAHIYCAGEACGIGGVDLALVEGEIAGLAAAGRRDLAAVRFPTRDKARHFAEALDQTFALRDELRTLANDESIVCRCEDVRLGQLRTAAGWRAAKLHLRCGMGPCQGRICGPAVHFLLGWNPESVRPPLFPARVASIISSEEGATK
jgi:NADPH-dependent 2,4-dienoyl-CoA reductase/sulfur reductase-like enzyme